MTKAEIIESLEVIAALIEWECPMQDQVAIKEAIAILQEKCEIETEIEKLRNTLDEIERKEKML